MRSQEESLFSASQHYPPPVRESAVVVPSRMIIQADASRFGVLEKADRRHWVLNSRLDYRRGLMFSHLHPFPQLVGGYMLELSITRRHVRQANVLFAGGHMGSESLR